MKKYIFISLYVFIFLTCKSQEEVIDVKRSDVIIFNFKSSNVMLIDNGVNEFIDTVNQNVIFKQTWLPYGSLYIDKYYSFIKNTDTMNIHCIFGQEENLYFKNLEFRKGNYEFRINFGENKVTGYDIDKEVQIFFKNSYVYTEEPQIFYDLYFKELKFYEINTEDKNSVQIKRLVH